MTDIARAGVASMRPGRVASFVSLVFLLPALHPALIPLVGVASHLLWFTHALPVAYWSRQRGRVGALLSLLVSFVLVVIGERTFGTGYGSPAPWDMAWSLGIAAAFSNALVASFAVLTRRALLEYQTLFDGAPIGVLRVDSHGRVRLANRRAAQLLGVRDSSLVNQNLTELLPVWSAPDVTTARTSHQTVLHAATAARDRRLDIVHTVLPDGDVQVLVLDVTQEFGLRAQLEQAQKMELVGRFAGSIAHDFGNLLLSIGASIELALDSVLQSESAVPDLEDAQRGVASARALTRQLLTFSRRTSTNDARILDARTIADETSALVRRLLRSNVTLTVTSHTDPLRVYADPVQLQQVLLNLAVNAQDAMPDGGSIEIFADRVETTMPHLGGMHVGSGEERNVTTGWVLLRVEDNGTGIPPSLIERIFEPFFTTKGEENGTGLGLSTVVALADRMGAELRVQSTLGIGTRFDLYVPPVAAAEAPLAQ